MIFFSFGQEYFLGIFSSLSLSFLSITIVNIALFVLNFLNLPQGNILTKAEKNFKTLKDTSIPLPVWYQDGLTNKWKSKKLISGKRVCFYFSRWIQRTHDFLFRRFNLRGPPSIQTRSETTKTSGGRNSNTSHGDFKNFQKTPHSTSSTL